MTLGSPIAIGIANRDFANWEDVMGPLSVDAAAAAGKRLTRPRPGHADLAGGMKYGAADLRDVLERASARESAARVAAGAVCKLLLAAVRHRDRERRPRARAGVDTGSPRSFASLEKVREDSPLRAVDSTLEPEMVAAVDAAKKDGETLGGAILVGARGVPAGLGLLRRPGTASSTGASARRCSRCRPSRRWSSARRSRPRAGPAREAHDEIEHGPDGALRRRTNRAGGLEAGVTNGEDVVAVAYMKPISTLARGLDSVDLETGEPARSAYERSDVTAVPACGVICEAMLAFVLADALLELTGGDRLEDVLARLAAHRERVRRYPRIRQRSTPGRSI